MGLRPRMRRNERGVSPVIGELLMVMLVVSLAVVAYVMLSGMLQQPDEEPLSVVLRTPKVHQRGAVYDAVIAIQTVSPKEDRPPWAQLFIVVISSNGSALNSSTPLGDDSTATYHDYVEFWFVEIEGSENKCTPGDSIKITGMDASYQGAEVTLLWDGDRVGEIKLPEHFF